MLDQMQPPAEPLLQAIGITKLYGSFVANDHIDLDLHAAQIHALLGENGAGKSTFSACLYGLLQPDAGEIAIDGVKVELTRPAKAIACGIGMVHQHFVLVPGFTVLENIVVGTGSGFRTSRSVFSRSHTGADAMRSSGTAPCPSDRFQRSAHRTGESSKRSPTMDAAKAPGSLGFA